MVGLRLSSSTEDDFFSDVEMCDVVAGYDNIDGGVLFSVVSICAGVYGDSGCTFGTSFGICNF